MYRITNISNANLGIEGVVLAPREYKDVATLSSDLTNFSNQGLITIVDLLDAGEEAEQALAGSLNAGGDALSVVNLTGTGLDTKSYVPTNASGSVSNATPVVVNTSRLTWPRNVWVIPNSATVRVEYSSDGGNTYTAWPSGDVTVAKNDTLLYPVSTLRFTKISGTSFTYGVE